MSRRLFQTLTVAAAALVLAACSGEPPPQFRNTDITGADYARTLAHWHSRFEAQWPAIKAQGFDERFRRMWRFYLAYCEAGFETGDIDVHHYVFAHAGEAG